MRTSSCRSLSGEYQPAIKGYVMQAIKAEDLVDTIRTALLVLDKDQRVISANRAFYSTFAVKPDETVGRPLFATAKLR